MRRTLAMRHASSRSRVRRRIFVAEANQMLVKDVMTKSPTCCSPSDRVDAVAKLMLDRDCGAIPVRDGSRVVGMITDRDVVCRVIATGKNPAAVPVSEVMSKHVYTVSEDADAEEAVDLMKNKLVRRLPVVDAAGNLVGIVAPSDLAPTLASHNVADFLLAVSYWNRKSVVSAA